MQGMILPVATLTIPMISSYARQIRAALLEEFFKDSDLPKEFTDRVSYIVSHHHTIDGIDGIDYQIMIEADYLVNADESNFSGNNVRNMLEKVFKTETGKFLLKSMYQKRLDSAEEK